MSDSRRSFLKMSAKIAAVSALPLALVGCDEDKRKDEERLNAKPPEFATRYVMHCPKCSSPTVPYSINNSKSFYKCTGNPPQYALHTEKRWSRRIDDGPEAKEK